MSVMKKVKTILSIAIAVPLVIGFAALMAWQYFKGEGALHVLAPFEQSVTVSIDGESKGSLPATSLGIYDVARGPHTVEIKVDSSGDVVSYDFEARSGFWNGVAPASKDQCMVQLDATEAYYSGAPMKNGLPPLPKLEERFRGGAAVADLNGAVYFSEDALPFEIEEGHKVHLVFEIPCPMMDAPDSKIIVDYLGFEGYEKKGLLGK